MVSGSGTRSSAASHAAAPCTANEHVCSTSVFPYSSVSTGAGRPRGHEQPLGVGALPTTGQQQSGSLYRLVDLIL